jgi:hypothetical protein
MLRSEETIAHTDIYVQPWEEQQQHPANVSGKLNAFLLLFSGVPGRAQVERVGWRRAPGCVAAGECEEEEEADTKKGHERRNEWEQMRWKGLEIVVSWLAVACVG